MPAECVVNISEGRDPIVIGRIAAAAGDTLLDVHSDPEHHRSVLTLGGTMQAVEDAARSVVEVAVSTIDLTAHSGAHPRLGSADVVPFVPLPPGGPVVGDGGPGPALGPAIDARDRFAHWAGATLGLPCFLYGPERSLPEVRRSAFRGLVPDTGPPTPHPTAGATAVGARHVLVAYNVWIVAAAGTGDGDGSVHLAKRIASDLRSPAVRALGLKIGDVAQVSCNLVDPSAVGPADAYDTVARAVESAGGEVVRAELVGLVPREVLERVPRHRHRELDLDEGRTIEARLASAGVPATDPGR